jgi:hypothetical protein
MLVEHFIIARFIIDFSYILASGNVADQYFSVDRVSLEETDSHYLHAKDSAIKVIGSNETNGERY